MRGAHDGVKPGVQRAKRANPRIANPTNAAPAERATDKFGVRRQSETSTALWIIARSKAVSRYDHPSAGAALGTPVLATALQIRSPAEHLGWGGSLNATVRYAH